MEHHAQEISESDIEAFTRREVRRFRDGTYKSVPVLGYTDVQEALEYYAEICDRPKLNHFTHLSLKNMPHIAYTDNERNGVNDRQKSLKIGRYLTRFCRYKLSEKRILELVDEHNAMFDERESGIAITSDEIVDVYLTGPNSCMSHSVAHYRTDDVHPVSTYGAGDVGVFYLKNKVGDVSGRALVALKSKVYGRIYGDDARMSVALAKAGYRPDEDNIGFNGCELRIMKNEEMSIIAPYLDGSYSAVMVTGKHDTYHFYMANTRSVSMLRAVDTYSCDETTGLAECDGTMICEGCDCRIPEDEHHISEDYHHNTLCSDCYDECHSPCAECDEYHHHDNLSYIESADVDVCEYCHVEHYRRCSSCEETYSHDDLYEADDDDDLRCDGCHQEHLSTQEEEVANEAA